MKKKATEDNFNELHNLVTKEFLSRIKSGEASTADLKAACDWLKTNDISGVAYDGNPLDKLANIMPTIDPEMVQQRLYGFVKKEKRCYDQDQINSTKKKFFMPMPENGPFYT